AAISTSPRPMRRLPLTGRPRWGVVSTFRPERPCVSSPVNPARSPSSRMAAHGWFTASIKRSWARCRRRRRDSFDRGGIDMPHQMGRAAYAQMFGPTVGDKVRLADTDLIIEVEKDFTTYGEEVKFGGGKVIRDGMGQSQRSRREGAVDTV